MLVGKLLINYHILGTLCSNKPYIGFWWLKRGSFKILANGTSAMKNGSLIIEQSYFNNER
jgi:hypothetical protein